MLNFINARIGQILETKILAVHICNKIDLSSETILLNKIYSPENKVLDNKIMHKARV